MECPRCEGLGWYQTHATGGGPCGLNMLFLMGLARPCNWCWSSKEVGKISKGWGIALFVPALVVRIVAWSRIEWEYRRAMRAASARGRR